MLSTLRTLWIGEGRRREEQLRSAYAVELIDQKLRECEAGLLAAKGTLAALIQRERAERRMREGLDVRIAALEAAARRALAAGDEPLARDTAQAIADLRTERALRSETLARLESRTRRLRASVETAQRRLVELRHGALQARAVRREHEAQARLGCLTGQPDREAKDLIRRVLEEDDPLERSEILREIDEGGSGAVERRLRDAGHLPGAVSAEEVLASLRADPPAAD